MVDKQHCTNLKSCTYDPENNSQRNLANKVSGNSGVTSIFAVQGSLRPSSLPLVRLGIIRGYIGLVYIRLCQYYKNFFSNLAKFYLEGFWNANFGLLGFHAPKKPTFPGRSPRRQSYSAILPLHINEGSGKVMHPRTLFTDGNQRRQQQEWRNLSRLPSGRATA